MEKPELEIKIRDVDYGPKLKDAFFGIGIMIASSIISYAIVTLMANGEAVLIFTTSWTER